MSSLRRTSGNARAPVTETDSTREESGVVAESPATLEGPPSSDVAAREIERRRGSGLMISAIYHVRQHLSTKKAWGQDLAVNPGSVTRGRKERTH
jgi:hypothetical protein